MEHIYKYVLPVIEIPQFAEIIHVALQHNRPTVWAKVDTQQPITVRVFAVLATGAAIPEGYTYIGTCFDGPLVWHVFEDPVGLIAAVNDD